MMRLHHRCTDLQRGTAPFPIAAIRAAGEGEHFTELFRCPRQRHIKYRREVRSGFSQLAVEHDIEIKRHIRAGVAATAVDASQFVKTNGCRVTSGRIEQHREMITFASGLLEQHSDVQFPARALLGGQRSHMPGNRTVPSTQFQRLNPFVTDISSGFSFFIDQEGHDFSSGLPPGFLVRRR